MSRSWFPVASMLVLFLVSCASRPPAYQEQGWASYVADHYTGRMTSSGQIYYPQGYTAAHTSLPFGTVVTVQNIMNGREIQVTINDRFPYYPGRVINLSSAAAQHIGIPYMQMGQVKVTATSVGHGAYGQQPAYGGNSYAGNGYGGGGYSQQQPAYSYQQQQSYQPQYQPQTYQQQPAYQPQPTYQPQQTYQPQTSYGNYKPKATYPSYTPSSGGGYQVQPSVGGAPNAPSYSGGGTPPGLKTF